MKSKLKKSLSLLLALVMAMSCMSLGAFAAGDGTGYNGATLPTGPENMTAEVIDVTAENAQYVLDGAYGNINNKTINFTESINTVLELALPTKYAGSGTTGNYPNYYRTVSNVTFTANSHVTLAGFYFAPGHAANDNAYEKYDYVLDRVVTSNNDGHYRHTTLSGITFQGLTIEGSVEMWAQDEYGTISAITFKNCVITNNNGKAINLNSRSPEKNAYGAVTVQNCTITAGNEHGVYVNGAGDSVTVTNSYVTAKSNAIQIVASTKTGANASATITGNYLKSDKYTVNLSNVLSDHITFTGNAVVAGSRGHLGYYNGDASGNFWAEEGSSPDETGKMTSTITEPTADTSHPESSDITCTSYYTTYTATNPAPSVGASFTLGNLVNLGGETETTFVGNTDEAIRTQLGNSDAIIVTPDTTAADYNPDKTYVAYKDSDENLVKATLDVNIVEATTGIESTLDASDAQVTALNSAAANAGEQIEKSQINIAKYAKDFNVSSGTLDFGYSMTLKTSATNSVKFDIKPTVKVGNAAAVELGSDYVNQSTGMTVLMPIPSDWANAKVLHYKDDSTTEAMAGVEIVTVDNAKYAKFQAKSFSDYEAQKDAPYVGYVKSIGANVGNTIYLNVRMVFTNPQSGMKLKYEVGGNAAKYYALPTAASDGSYQFQIPVIAKYFGVKGTISIVNSDDTETYYISKGEAGEHVTSVQYSVYDYLDLLEKSNVASSWLELSTAIRNLGNASARHWGDTYNQSMQDVSWIAYLAN